MEMHGEYREVTPDTRLVNTESWGADWSETLSTLVLKEENGRTMVQCTLLYPSQEARDRVIGTGMLEGLAAAIDRLQRYLGATA